MNTYKFYCIGEAWLNVFYLIFSVDYIATIIIGKFSVYTGS